MYQAKELFSCLLTVEGSCEIGCSGHAVLFLHTAHLHTHVFGFHHYHNSQGVERMLDAIFNLHRHPFLHLQSPCKNIHHAGNLAQTRDFAIGDIRNMRLPEKR